MQRHAFAYSLPDHLIATCPAPERSASRLFCLNGATGEAQHGLFHQIINSLDAGDLLVFNDTRVLPARAFGQKASGGKVELLVERLLSPHTLLAQIRASKAPKAGSSIILEDGTAITLLGRHNDLFHLQFPEHASALDVLNRIGHMPLPPYIQRADTPSDRERYQTVYGKHLGAVAAPTAGLHFDEALLQALKDKGVQFGYVTLHVGAGTFSPVRCDNIKDHPMHKEWMQVSAELCQQVADTQQAGKRVIAVGTTSVRCLETAAASGQLQPYNGDTQIFIYPGYRFNVVDALITNFHLSESTLLMLVCAFAGYKRTLAAYHTAVEQAYRFFSYGDAMFITRNPNALNDLPPQEPA